MSFRDDRDADRARIAALEAELARANQQIAELEGRRSQALVLSSSTSLARSGSAAPDKLPWYGAPMELALTRTFTGEFPRDAFEDLLEVIRAVTRSAGRTELLRSSMTWSAGSNERSMGPFTVITVSVKDGRTTLVATDRLGQLAGGLYGGIGGGVGGGTAFVPVMALLSVPVLIPVALVGWLGTVFLGTRAIFKRAARRRAEALQQVFDAVVAEISARIATAAPAP
ncbi:MAG: hypothetical protein JWP01_1587 [Myxococcales bacterium]|nr:hypothetical protein [Myxococcales bacterium]